MNEAELAALRERLSRGIEDAGEPVQTSRLDATVVVDKADLRAALALIVRLGQVEAAVASLERRVEELDAEREYAWRVATIKEERDRALAPAEDAP